MIEFGLGAPWVIAGSATMHVAGPTIGRTAGPATTPRSGSTADASRVSIDPLTEMVGAIAMGAYKAKPDPIKE